MRGPMTRTPSPPAGRSNWELVDFYSAVPGDTEEPPAASPASPPRSPSRAWLDEYTAVRPIRSRPRTTLATSRTRVLRREAQLEAERLAAEIEAPPPLRQVRPREEEGTEWRIARRRRIAERRAAAAEGNVDSPWVQYEDGDPFPQIQPPSLRRSDSSWENAAGRDFIRDAAGRIVTDHPHPRRRNREDDTGETERDSRRDGVVFEPLSPALPSSAISAASGTEGRFGPSYHLPEREGGLDIGAYGDILRGDGTTGTSRNFGLGMRSVSVEGLMGVDGVDRGEADELDPWAQRSESEVDPSLFDAPPAFGLARTNAGPGDLLFTAREES